MDRAKQFETQTHPVFERVNGNVTLIENIPHSSYQPSDMIYLLRHPYTTLLFLSIVVALLLGISSVQTKRLVLPPSAFLVGTVSSSVHEKRPRLRTSTG